MLLINSDSKGAYWGCSIFLLIFFVPKIIDAIFGERWRKEHLKKEDHRRQMIRVQYFNEIKLAAQNDDPGYVHKLCECYFKGDGTDKNEEQGRQLLEFACNLNYPEAIFDTARFTYLEMYGYTKNINEAFILFQRAYILGIKDAKYYIDEIKSKYHLIFTDEYSKYLLNLDNNEFANFKVFFEQCESEPEQILLTALVEKAMLKPKNRVLEGKIKLQLQASIGQYRADFLINGWLAVEVDGKKFHQNDKSFVNDRIRDQNFLKLGITTFRAPASQVYKTPNTLAADIIRIAKSKN